MNEAAGERSQCCNRCYVWTVRILCLPVFCVVGAIVAVAFVLALPVLLVIGPIAIYKQMQGDDPREFIHDWVVKIGYANEERGGGEMRAKKMEEVMWCETT